ncbi:hypothetical protein AFGD_008748 [Aspergillus flavus]|nr:hypothetical protein AFGD_008748 [Aspergillus flavus]
MSRLGKYLYPSDGVLAHRLPFGLYMKSCARSQRNEAVALRLVEEHTSAVAPLWIDDYEEDGKTTLIMTQVQGQPLDRVLHRLSYQEREQLSNDLKKFIRQIRCIPNHTLFRFANTFGNALYDHRVGGEFGPFAETSDFISYLIPEHTSSETRNAITPVLSRPYRSFFSHADLHSTNILISQGRLSGIVDWECAGYFPEYWEFTKAIFGIINNEALEKIMRNSFDEDYGDELDVERTLWRDSPFETLTAPQNVGKAESQRELPTSNMDVYGAYKTRLDLLEDEERTILELKGALEIPPQAVQNELIDAFFSWVAPVLPVVNQRVFLSMYKNPLNPPSLLLLQAIFLAGSHVVEEKGRDKESSPGAHSSMVYLQRAKALYDAEFEKDHTTVVQALLLMSWYWQGTEGESVGILES